MDRVDSMTAFATVVTSGSFAAAAKRLNMSPAMVTKHVQSLEDRLGARLLNRTTRKLSVTEAGRAYYDRCAQILAQIEEADISVSALHSAPRGTLRLNAATVLSHGVSSLIGKFTAAYPEIAIELITTDRMVDLVEEGIDVAIRFNQAPDSSSLVMRRLGRFRLILCAAPAYFERHSVPQRPGDLAEHNCVAYMYRGFDTLTREWRFVGPDGEVTAPISGNVRTNSIETILSAALEGRGIIQAPVHTIYEYLCAGRLTQVLPEYHLGEFPIIALYPHRQHLSAKVRDFIDFAAKHFTQDPRWMHGECTHEKAFAL
jgi:DNA-binding transcriptional LysR family regulator